MVVYTIRVRGNPVLQAVCASILAAGKFSLFIHDHAHEVCVMLPCSARSDVGLVGRKYDVQAFPANLSGCNSLIRQPDETKPFVLVPGLIKRQLWGINDLGHGRDLRYRIELLDNRRTAMVLPL